MSSRHLFIKSSSTQKNWRRLLIVGGLLGVAFIVMFPREHKLDEWTWQSPIEPPGVTIVSNQPEVLAQGDDKATASVRLGAEQPITSPQPSANAVKASTGNTPAEMMVNDHAQIRKVLELWSSAWSSRNMEAYFEQYAKSFVPAGGQSRVTWEKMRRQRILSKSQITHEIRDLQISVDGDQATANFEQMYATEQTRLVGPKTLRLQREGLGWHIISESSN